MGHSLLGQGALERLSPGALARTPPGPDLLDRARLQRFRPAPAPLSRLGLDRRHPAPPEKRAGEFEYPGLGDRARVSDGGSSRDSRSPRYQQPPARVPARV